jgi:hypothetical protein
VTDTPFRELLEKSFRVCQSLALHGSDSSLSLDAFADEIAAAREVSHALHELGVAAVVTNGAPAAGSDRDALRLLAQARSLLKALLANDGDGRVLQAKAAEVVDAVDDLFGELVLG